MWNLVSKFLILIFALAFLSGCEIFEPTHTESVGADVAATWWDGPRIKPGVALVIQVGTPAAPPVVVNAMVDQNGEVTMPLLLQEPVACDGLTLEAFRQKLIKAYSAYYRQPQVTVTFAPFDPKSGVSPWGTITVLGEVTQPGPVNIPPTQEMTVTKALQLAGGVKPFADRSRICVTRCDKDGRQVKTYVDLKEIGKEGRADKDLVLRAGDVVWVPETWY